jgi:hypothetical protein
MLSRSAIWFAPSHAFNDPFDCTARRKFEFTSDKELIAKFAPIEEHQRKISRNEAITYLKQVVTDDDLRDQYLEKKSRSFQKVVLQSFGIYTLSKTPKEILMWSHYADSHKGFCIEYRRTPDNMLADAQKVMYPKDDEFPHIDYFAPDANKLFEEVSKIVLTKSQRWEYEKEWRILQKGYVQKGLIDDSIECSDEESLNMVLGVKMEITTKSRHRKYQRDWRIPPRVRGPYSGHESTYPDDMLRGIIFGLEMSNGDRKEIRHVLSGKNVKYYEARPVTNRFELQIAEIE